MEELAEELGVRYSTLWRKLNGKIRLDYPFLQRLAETLNVSVSYLTLETDDPTPVSGPESETAKAEESMELWEAEQELSKEAGVTVNLKASMDVFKKELDIKDIEKIKEMIKALRESGEKGHIGLNIDLTEATDDDLL